jgi:hypothetical protein
LGGSVGVGERLSGTEDEDSRRRGADRDVGVEETLRDWDPDVALLVSIVEAETTKEITSGASDAVEQEQSGGDDGPVDTVLNVGEDGNEDSCDEDHGLKRLDSPEDVDLSRRGEKVGNCVDDDCGETGHGDPVEGIG